jgi:hypothetical protein
MSEVDLPTSAAMISGAGGHPSARRLMLIRHRSLGPMRSRSRVTARRRDSTSGALHRSTGTHLNVSRMVASTMPRALPAWQGRC